MKTKQTLAYAIQIQPRNGNQLSEHLDLEIDTREWDDDDTRRFPDAGRSLWSGAKLVVDRETDEVFAIEA